MIFVCAISLFPKDSGGAVRIFNTIKYLSEAFEIYFFSFKPIDFKLTYANKKYLRNYTKQYFFFEKKIFKSEDSFFSDFQPYWFADYESDELKLAIANCIKKNQINIIQVEFTQLLYLVKYLPKSAKKIYIAHDISTISFLRRIMQLKSLRIILTAFFKLVEIYVYERYYFPKFDIVCSVSNEDQKSIVKWFNVKKILTAKNGIEKVNFINKKPPKKIIKLGYIGSFTHTPNKFAISYFLSEIVPLLEKKGVQFKFYIAGKNNPYEIKSLITALQLKSKSSIIDLGFTPTVRSFFKEIDILVAPIFSGSGSRIKILESLSFSVPVISSKIGAEGLSIDNDYLSIANNKEEFVQKIIDMKEKLSHVDESQRINLIKSLEPLLWKNIFREYSKKIL